MRLRIILLILVCSALLGCSLLPGGREHVDAAKVKQAEVERRHEVDMQPEQKRPFDVRQDFYVGSQSVPLRREDQLPPVFAREIVMVSAPMGLEAIAQEMSRLTGYSVSLPSFEPGSPTSSQAGGVAPVPPSLSASSGTRFKPMPLQYRGTVKGFLDAVAAFYNFTWDFSDQRIAFAKYVTRTFSVAANAGRLGMLNRMTNKSTSGSSATGTTGTTGTTNDTTLSGEQTASLSYDFDLFKETVENVQGMLSKEGRVVANRSAGTITVTDIPSLVEAVATYIEQTNDKLKQQVALRVRVYSLTMKDEQEHGVDLDGIFSRSNGLKLATQSPFSADTLTGVGTATASIVSGKGALKAWSGSDAVLRALQTVGEVSIVTSGSGITMNNQPFPLQNVDSLTYLASSNVTNTTNVGTLQQLEPGTVVTGFSMMITPHILDPYQVILQYSISLSALEGLTEIKSGDNKIQAPEISTKSFMQRVHMPLGSTLVLAGFEDTRKSVQMGSGLFGVKRTSQANRQTIVISIEANRV